MRGVPLGRLFGIPLEINSSWLFIFLLLTWSLAAGAFPGALPDRAPAVYWLLAAFTSVVFFVCLIAHELGHSLTAIRLGVKVRRITLFFFGGVAQLEGNLKNGLSEVWVALAGPVVSFVLAGLFWLLSQVGGEVGVASAWLARINLLLALFNLLPGFPLDGGRVLRGAIWAATKSFARATQVAVSVGALVSWGLIAYGVLTVLRGNLFGGIWIIVIALFLQNAAVAEASQSGAQQALAQVPRARTLAQDDWPTVPRDTRLQTIADLVLETGRRAYPVVEDGRFFGLVTLVTLRGAGRERWPFMTADAALLTEVHSVLPTAGAMDALRVMTQHNVHQLPVLDAQGVYYGMISRDQLMALLQLYSGEGNDRSPRRIESA
ncbi:site-2 protease family protein [Deinococcus peraridilitoris]|uniref:Zinc metalloprotease n=1 Tax=Deinococcus peraridilitoris (strain DSM 19664 / LMG 22246 / CIP 109416 / KR-200) TaxID=937777 RepID=L0A3T3_DEIPD|nr:site-2 protease family protein [Deinococcus peraridilitoris]AFZ67852.1 Zn-dependent protease [Deinococcus peraridilitoris DSM 19664]